MTSSAADQGQAPAQVSRIRETLIAIVGMSCLMPHARSLPEFWENILDKATGGAGRC